MTRISKLKPANTLLEIHFKELGLKDWISEHPFALNRKWRFDYYLGDGLAVEIEGGVYTQGRHTRGKGFEDDCDKYNMALMMGYRVLRFTTGQVLRGEAKAFLKHYLEASE